MPGPVCVSRLLSWSLRVSQQPGDIAEIHDGPGDPRIVASDGTQLRPKGPIQRPNHAAAPIFAERGKVIVHPEVQRTRGNWRFVHSSSFDDLDEWERRLRRRLITAVAAIIGLLAYVALLTVASLDGDPPRMGRGTANTIGTLVLTILAGRRRGRGEPAGRATDQNR